MVSWLLLKKLRKVIFYIYCLCLPFLMSLFLPVDLLSHWCYFYQSTELPLAFLIVKFCLNKKFSQLCLKNDFVFICWRYSYWWKIKLRDFPFSIFKMSFHYLLSSIISRENSAIILIAVPINMMCCFFLWLLLIFFFLIIGFH